MENNGSDDAGAMENIAPPPPPSPKPGQPVPASPADIAALRAQNTVTKSIAGAAGYFNSTCTGQDRLENNCAHFLSDAFIRAGYDELLPPNACINARCETGAKRPVRARDMWCWFKKLATEEAQTLPKGKGFWAVFQLDETVYFGGHVLIIDTDTNIYYGTGNYPDWTQHCYKW